MSGTETAISSDQREQLIDILAGALAGSAFIECIDDARLREAELHLDHAADFIVDVLNDDKARRRDKDNVA